MKRKDVKWIDVPFFQEIQPSIIIVQLNLASDEKMLNFCPEISDRG